MSHWSSAIEKCIKVQKVNEIKMQIIIGPTGEIRTPGVSFPGKIKLFQQENNLIIIKVAGGSEWSGIGETTYYRPQYIVGTIENGIMTIKYEVEYGKSTMKEGKQKALELFESLKSKGEIK